MPAFRFFDPWAELKNPDGLSVPSARIAKAAAPKAATQKGLAPLANLAAIPEAFSDARPTCEKPPLTQGEAKERRGAIVNFERAIPRIGLPEIPDEPTLPRDGRRLWRFPPAEDCTPDRAAALIEEAHWCGAVLVPDGGELIVLEPWLSTLPIDTLCELRRRASGVISVLHQPCRARSGAITPNGCC